MRRSSGDDQSVRERGASLFELLVSLVLTGVIAALLLSSLTRARSADTEVRKIAERRNAEARINHLVRRLVRDTDSHRLSIEPIIHPLGRILLHDGTPSGVMGAGALSPHPQAQALSNLRVDGSRAMIVRYPRDGAGDLSRITACSTVLRPALALSQVDSFIGITGEGEVGRYELAAHFTADDSCAALSLRPLGSVMAGALPQSAMPRVLLPVDEEYTLYVDTRRAFRHLCHHGRALSCNQPVLLSAPLVEYTPRRSLGSTVPELDIKMRWSESAPPAAYSHTGLFAREAPFNLLFNLIPAS